MENARDLYLDLMKRCLTNWIYGDSEYIPISGTGFLKRNIIKALAARGTNLFILKPFNQQEREEGRDWPPSAHTMIGFKRLDNLRFCVEDILANKVTGDLIEAGVWRGGASIFIRAILKAHGVKDRRVWVADSFEGLPPPNPEKYPHDANDKLYTYKELAVSLDQVKANFERYELLDEQVRFLKGWFCDTLPNAPVDQLAIIRADGDMYESTMDILTNLYPKLSIGGYIIIDDYGCVPACCQAVHDYREAQGIHDEIIPIDWGGVYWKRSH